MITEFLMSIPFYLVRSLINIIPAGGGVPSEFTSALHTMWGYVQSFSFILPVNTILWCIGVTIAFEVGIFLWGATNWLLKRFKL